MKRTIEKPFSVGHKFYIVMIGISFCGIIISCHGNKGFDWNEIIKNISFGCFASAIVAWLIEIYNVQQKNQKTFLLYDSIYIGLKYSIEWYIETWGRISQIGYHLDKTQKYTWLEWYDLCKSKFAEQEFTKQEELLEFFKQELQNAIEKNNKEIHRIKEQEYILMMNDVFDEKIKRILSDYDFEFYAAELELHRKDVNADEFWKKMDVINSDMKQYIENWVDICFYNEIQFSPYSFWEDAKLH